MVMNVAFPTGREYVSFSEIRNWWECTFRHNLLYVQQLGQRDDTIYTDFGTIVHEAIEQYTKTRKMDVQIAVQKLKDVWKERDYPNTPNWAEYSDPALQFWIDSLAGALVDIPDFLDENFQEWELINAEEELDEPIEGQSLRFRGYIDAIFAVKDKRGKELYWIIDWKTAGKSGWRRSKRQDPFVRMQLVFYKHFWAQKHSVPIKDIRCCFVLLKRGASKNRCQLLTVSAGPKTIEKALLWMRSMIKMVADSRAIKNRYSCMFCEFENTVHCELNL